MPAAAQIPRPASPAAAPSAAPDNVELVDFVPVGRAAQATQSIAYGAGARRTLDIYRPRGATAAPVIVFFYGGSWQSGSKGMYRFLARALTRRGYVAVVPDYRIYPEVTYPGFIEDGALAVRWVKDNAARFGGDPGRLFLMGHSAGAYIAAMLAIDGRWLSAVGLEACRDISGWIGVAGPYDFLPLRDGTLRTIFGEEPATQPITHVAPGAPAALLLTGVKDRVVDPGNSRRLAAKLHDAGGEGTVRMYRRAGHLTIMAAFAPFLRFIAPVLRDTDSFIKRIGAAP